MKYMADTIDESNHLANRINNLFRKYPNIDSEALGFIDDWENEPLWK